MAASVASKRHRRASGVGSDLRFTLFMQRDDSTKSPRLAARKAGISGESGGIGGVGFTFALGADDFCRICTEGITFAPVSGQGCISSGDPVTINPCQEESNSSLRVDPLFGLAVEGDLPDFVGEASLLLPCPIQSA